MDIFSRVAADAYVGIGGVGFDLSTRLSERWNLRVDAELLHSTVWHRCEILGDRYMWAAQCLPTPCLPRRGGRGIDGES
jgi:hypothetical protein